METVASTGQTFNPNISEISECANDGRWNDVADKPLGRSLDVRWFSAFCPSQHVPAGVEH